MPYPDECLYSILCRYCVRISYTSLKSIRKLLFGSQQCLASLIFFPIRMDLIEQWYGTESDVDRKYIAESHTMHPYAKIVYPRKFRRQVDAVIGGEPTSGTFDKTGTQRTHRLWPKFLRYCPECVRDDVGTYGETYWHRVHQLPAMMYCTKHDVRLYDSDIKVTGTHMGFHPASAEELVVDSDAVAYDSIFHHKEKFLKIGFESEWLLKHGASIDWEFDLHAKYKLFFRDKGIATVQGVSDYNLIASAFEDYWGLDFLDCLRSELSDDRDWVRQIYEAGMISYKPIYHILLMCFLCGSVEAFMSYAPQENIFGNSPWVCLNKLCAHYGVDGVETVDIRYLNGTATGFFTCASCGMVYKQRYFRKKFSALYIVEYGDVWLEQMIQCLRDEKLDIPTTASIMQCKPHVVKWQMKKLGILGNPEYYPKSRASFEFGAEAHYKAQVLDLLEKHSEVTSYILKQYAPNAYRYLYKFDLDWLHKHMTYAVNSKQQLAEDDEMLQRVKAAVAKICADGMPKRQITPGLLAAAAGYEPHMLVYLEAKRPRTKEYVDNVVESRKDWLKRRITAIAQVRKEVGEKITLADIKREMSLKPNTFVKHGEFMKELMDELNG